MHKDLLVLILSRKNSTRLKKKNHLIIKKKNLFNRTLIFALKNFNRKQILVSTDDEKIIDFCKKKNVICPWKRPKYISKKNTSSYLSALHAVKWYENNFNKIKKILLLQPTTPFRSNHQLSSIFKLFKKKKNRAVISYTKINLNNKSYKKYFLYKLKKIKKSFISKNYIPDGAYFLIQKKDLFKSKSFFPKNKTIYYNKTFKYGLDIDVSHDYKLAKKIR